MNFDIVSKDLLKGVLIPILKNDFGFEDNEINDGIKSIEVFLTDLQSNVSIGIEFPYVDKVYRNSYYHYYSSKFKKYPRDCIRLSFFVGRIRMADFFDKSMHSNLQENFLGMLVLRPLPKNIIGRNILRPDIFKKDKPFFVQTTIGMASIYGVKFTIEGFPHASQDSEMNVCAETCLWSILEYFSHRYPDYKPLLPDKIHKIISERSSQRQIPSPGLNISDMSYVLKRSGFGVQIYDSKESKFFDAVKIYIESGIPIIAFIADNKGHAHVMSLIGRTQLTKNGSLKKLETLPNGSFLYDYYNQKAEYLCIDDNLRPYKSISLDDPLKNYNSFVNFKLSGIIVPLSIKINIGADKIREFATELIKTKLSIVPIKSHLIRTLLTSSRSYKHYITQNAEFHETAKTILVNVLMPKFIWVVELILAKDFNDNKASGVLILDATEPKTPQLIGYLIDGHFFGKINGNYGVYNVPSPKFQIFNNLNQF